MYDPLFDYPTSRTFRAYEAELQGVDLPDISFEELQPETLAAIGEVPPIPPVRMDVSKFTEANYKKELTRLEGRLNYFLEEKSKPMTPRKRIPKFVH